MQNSGCQFARDNQKIHWTTKIMMVDNYKSVAKTHFCSVDNQKLWQNNLKLQPGCLWDNHSFCLHSHAVQNNYPTYTIMQICFEVTVHLASLHKLHIDHHHSDNIYFTTSTILTNIDTFILAISMARCWILNVSLPMAILTQ